MTHAGRAALTALALAGWLAAPALAHAAGAPRAEFAGKLAPARMAGVADSVQEGVFRVPESRVSPGGRTIGLHVVVLPATGERATGDALTFLAGGGVVPATRYARFLSRALAGFRREHDVLLVDQRGTWNSSPLACAEDSVAGDEAPPADPCDVADVTRCREALAGRADLAAYSTEAAVADLDAVRAWLGYDRLDLYGASYGTKVAQIYLKRFPERVRCVVLHGVVPLDATIELEYAASAESTLARVFRACELDSACRADYPRLRAEFAALLTRPAISVRDSSGGRPRTLVVGDRLLRDFTQQSLGSAPGIERWPRLVHAAFAGDARPLARAWLGEGPPPPPGAPRGVFLSILCGESIARVDPARIAAATRGTFFGDYPIRRQLCQCAHWPRASLPADFATPAHAGAPALVLTGALDPVTPPRDGERVARSLGNATHVVLPARSHADVDPCVMGLIERFLLAGGPAGLDASCLDGARLHFASPIPADR